MARGEAVKRGVPVSVCRLTVGTSNCAGGDWASGWAVYVDTNCNGTNDAGETLRINARANPAHSITSAAFGQIVAFSPDGSPVAPAPGGDFVYADERGAAQNRTLGINPVGRPSIE